MSNSALSGLFNRRPVFGPRMGLPPVLHGLVLDADSPGQLDRTDLVDGFTKLHGAPLCTEAFCMQQASVFGGRKAFLYGHPMGAPKTPTPEELARGKRMEARRVAAGLTKVAVASALGIKYQTVQNWEKGKGFPKRDKLHKVVTLYKTSRNYLESGEDSAAAPAGDTSATGQLDAQTLAAARQFQRLSAEQRQTVMLVLKAFTDAMPDAEVASKLKYPPPPKVVGSISERQPARGMLVKEPAAKYSARKPTEKKDT